MKQHKWFRLFAVALALALVATACGGDDEDGEEAADTPEAATTTEAAAGDLEAFCAAIVDAEAQVIAATEDGPAPDEAVLDEALETAPEEVSAQVTTLIEGSREALETQDDSIFEDPEFQATDEEVDAYVLENCGNENYDVTATEYAFSGLPPTITAGPHGFKLENEGKELHEMIVAKFTDPSKTIEELIELPEKEVEKEIEAVGFLFAEPGSPDSQTLQLEAGKYGVVCFVSTGTTPDKEGDGPPHAFQGMIAEFTVE
jgi:hypothetical protein